MHPFNLVVIFKHCPSVAQSFCFSVDLFLITIFAITTEVLHEKEKIRELEDKVSNLLKNANL